MSVKCLGIKFAFQKHGVKGREFVEGPPLVVDHVACHETAQLLVVEYDEHKRIEYPFSGLDEIELAYAVTIHKSQGSEYPAVILPLLTGPRMLFNKNLLYTAVTRARRCVTILGSRQSIWEMIRNERQHRRYTSLCDRITEIREREDEWQ